MGRRAPTDRKIQQFRDQLLTWAAEHGRDFPWRHTRDPYRLLIAELMLRRTRSDQVARVYPEFLNRYPTLAQLAGAAWVEVKEILYPLGLEHRAEQVASFAAEAVENYGERLPSRPDELRRIRGVGHYVANAVACFAGDSSAPFVDVNVARVLGRVFGLAEAVDWRYADATARRQLVGIAGRCVSGADPRTYHYALLDFGALVCGPLPACPDCPMHRARICEHCRKNRPQTAGRRKRPTKGSP